MKATPPVLSMGMPVTTSGCVATTRPSATNRVLQVQDSTTISPTKEQVSTTADNTTFVSTKQKHKPIVQTIQPASQQQPRVVVPRFSTGVTTSVTKVVVQQQPAASLSSRNSPTCSYHQQDKLQVQVFPPLKPPRLEQTFLAAILMSEVNLRSFENDTFASTLHANASSSSSSNDDTNDSWLLQLSNNTNHNNWTLVAKDMATLVALDVLRVFLVKGTLQVWMKRTLLRALARQSRHLQYPLSLKSIAAATTKSGRRLLVPSQDDWTVRGIANYGQTCFLNSVLQALTSLEPFLIYLERIVQLQHYSQQQSSADDDDACISSSLSETLWHLLQALQHEAMDPVDPLEVLRLVSEEHLQFIGREQQDAQELLQALLGMVISDARLDSSTQSSLESSILCCSSHDADQEFLSLSAFLTRMDEEQKSVAGSSLENSEALPMKMNGHSTQQNGHAAKDIVTNGHAVAKDYNMNGHYKKEPDEVILEEKKQEDFEHAREVASMSHVNGDAPVLFPPTKLKEAPILTESWIPDVLESTSTTLSLECSQMSASTMLMLQTLSPITPSPLSGWLGSTIQCCNCHHVRPIQNAPFLDIPIVPSSVSNYLHGGTKKQQASTMRSCSLAHCLRAFTCVERVQDVECRNCTLQQDIAQLEDEVFMLQSAIKTVMARKKSGSEQVEGLQSELARAEAKMAILKQIDPDEGDDGLQDLTASMDEIDLGVETSEGKPRKPLRRGEAKKCLLFTRLPNVLCLHVQRRYYDPRTDRMAKTSQHVDFPEVLDLSPYCAYGGGKKGMPSWAGRGSGSIMPGDETKKIPSKLYKLMSVIEHRGNAYGGHYLTYRRIRTGKGDRWVRISDQSVMPIHWDDVRNCEAYMLFYEAI